MRLRFTYRAWKARLRGQTLEIALARALVKRGELAVDAGANKGAYLYWLRRAVGPGGTVLAFEPQPVLAQYLRDACVAFGWSNVDVMDVALSNRAGSAVLNVPGVGVSPAASLERGAGQTYGSRLDVRLDTLDAVLGARGQPPLRFLKVDVEGHELAVFQGAEQTLRRDLPPLLFECEERHLSTHSMDDVFAFLERVGYQGFLVRHESLLPVAHFDPAVHQARSSPQFWKEKDYFNNFLFVAGNSSIADITARL